MKDKNRTRGGKKISPAIENQQKGYGIFLNSPLFARQTGAIRWLDGQALGKDCCGVVSPMGVIMLNQKKLLDPEQWAYVMAHNYLHLAFGHFNQSVVPVPAHQLNRQVWNMACDIYVAKFLKDMKFGKPLCSDDVNLFPSSLSDEASIYEYLMSHEIKEDYQVFGTGSIGSCDMVEFVRPVCFREGQQDRHMEEFAASLVRAVSQAVGTAGGHSQSLERPKTTAQSAAEWFVNTYPLLGALAAGFRLIESREQCRLYDIHVAAVDVESAEIYINPEMKLSKEECKFVLAHEFLHAGLLHHQRCRGRDPYLWNVACDFVINSWLVEMNIGEMPHIGLLYDEELKGMSAEDIYDLILSDLRRFAKSGTFRGIGKGDIIGRPAGTRDDGPESLDDFYREALGQGLEYHLSKHRGFIPAGMVEEIRALAVPAIPWDVELSRWFDGYFGPLLKNYTYARPSRRQSSTPDIPRPSYRVDREREEGRTFGVVIDTSGSMDSKLLGKALGAVVSYAVAKDVPYIRLVFCDAAAYDAGYLAPEDIAGRVRVRGRGGTRLMPGIELLEGAKDFPKNGPILIITDGECDNLTVRRDYAVLLPKGKRAGFAGRRAKVFYFD